MPYCWMAGVAPELYGELAGSGLVVLKGDLNYRKLTHDCRWEDTRGKQRAWGSWHVCEGGVGMHGREGKGHARKRDTGHGHGRG